MEELDRVAALLSETKMADSSFCRICAPIDNDIHEMCAPKEEEKRRPVVYCLDCRQSMCHVCFGCHGQMRLSRSHAVVRVGETFSPCEMLRKSHRRCESHETEKEKLYCVECDSPICLKCYATDSHHQSHDVVPMFRVAKDGRDRLSEDLGCIQDFIVKGNLLLEEVALEEERFLENFDEIEDEIEVKKRTILSKFLLTGFDLGVKLQGHGTERISEIDVVLDEAKSQLVEPGELVDHLKNLVDIVPMSGVPDLVEHYSWIVENSTILSEFRQTKTKVVLPSKLENFQLILERCLGDSEQQLIDRIGNLVVNELSTTSPNPLLLLLLHSPDILPHARSSRKQDETF